MAISAYEIGDFPEADREMALVMEARNLLGDKDLGFVRAGVAERTFAALVKVRLNQPEAARALIVPALKFQRDLAPRNVDDPSQRLDLAGALYVAALAGVGNPSAQLAEAAALVDKLPAEMKGLKFVADWSGRIADEQKSRRK